MVRGHYAYALEASEYANNPVPITVTFLQKWLTALISSLSIISLSSSRCFAVLCPGLGLCGFGSQFSHPPLVKGESLSFA
jgi:hypothetical protein